MSARDLRPVGEDDLHGFVDGRLDSDRRAVVEAWLSQHPEAAERVAADITSRERLRARLAPVVAEPIPARLRVANLHARRPAPAARWLPVAAAVVVGLGLGGAGGWIGRGMLSTAVLHAASPLAQDAVAAYRTFVVEAAHPVEVRADERPYLEQWLSHRLDQTVRVPDLTAQGFRLMGGRVLPAGERPAALLMYDDDAGTRLTLYARAGTGAEGPRFRYAREGDVAAFSWIDGALAYVVTARTSEARLLTVAQAIDEQVRSAAAP